MKYGLYSIVDKKANFASKPFTAQNDEVAIRTISNSMKDPKSQDTEYVINPDDFHLIRIGYFEDATGDVIADKEKLKEFSELSVKIKSKPRNQ